MRKLTLLLGFLLALLAFALPALAAPAHKAVFVIGQKSYTVDGQAKTMDAAPFTRNGRSYVPVRYLALALGVAENDIIWVGDTGDVSLKLGDKLVQMKVGSRTLYVNGQAKQMDVAPLVRNGRTYLPARWVAEAFGYAVGWDEKARAVTVYPPGQEPPEVKPPVQPPVAGKVSLKDMPVLSDADLDAMGIKKIPLVKEWLPDKPGCGIVYPVQVVGYQVGSRNVTMWNYPPPSGRPIIYDPSQSDGIMLGVEAIKYRKKWTTTLSAPLAVGPGKTDYPWDDEFAATSVLEAFGIPKECWHWDEKNQVLTMRGADTTNAPAWIFGRDNPANRIRYIQIQAGTPYIKWVNENGRVEISEKLSDAPYVKDGRLIWDGQTLANFVLQLHHDIAAYGSGVKEPTPETDNLPALHL
ncbi:copper amine oxidase N-terminal domain-containing protein [Desulfofundulus thermosubterraneus]|uniref:Copper amine oxidase N-terminal domain-containing protein n=1 Tax=Desulfofundulus thermosubterraneus DSM 16057 TaxID=1121432 RepID=A0A1M6H048_9FIRM|nr:copper amine oxidase N-terminal domain-containing protein [Desulfofundulus thermosubterraneus]SHJ15578.1 Copper amine oxidase N-terminal domain-containing protein [Desulfofundulus thermosubterraneus DSM 16057]